MARPWEVGNYLEMGNFSVFVLLGWRFVFGIINRCGINRKWEGCDPFLFRCHHMRIISYLLSNFRASRASARSAKDIHA